MVSTGVSKAGISKVATGLALAVAMGWLVAGCSSSKDAGLGVSASKRVVEYGQPVPKGGGTYKVGAPYKIGGQWFHPKEDPNYRGEGIASWYGPDFHGRYTANGEIYDMDALTAAHPTMPMPSYAKVTNLANGREIVVRVNDRGPFARGREIDVSKRAAEVLGFKQNGVARVRVAYLGKAPLSGGDGWATNVRVAQKQAPQPAARPSHQPVRQIAARQPAPAPRIQPAASPQEPQRPIQVASTGALPAGSFPQAAAASPAPAGGTPAGGVYVQAGSFRDAGNAQRLAARLTDYGRVDVAEVGVGDATYYRVRVGPFADAGRAQAALGGARSAGADGARLLTIE